MSPGHSKSGYTSSNKNTTADVTQRSSAGPPSQCNPLELKVRTPTHTKHPGWHVEFESRVTHHPVDCILRDAGRPLHVVRHQLPTGPETHRVRLMLLRHQRDNVQAGIRQGWSSLCCGVAWCGEQPSALPAATTDGIGGRRSVSTAKAAAAWLGMCGGTKAMRCRQT